VARNPSPHPRKNNQLGVWEKLRKNSIPPPPLARVVPVIFAVVESPARKNAGGLLARLEFRGDAQARPNSDVAKMERCIFSSVIEYIQ